MGGCECKSRRDRRLKSERVRLVVSFPLIRITAKINAISFILPFSSFPLLAKGGRRRERRSTSLTLVKHFDLRFKLKEKTSQSKLRTKTGCNFFNLGKENIWKDNETGGNKKLLFVGYLFQTKVQVKW